MGAEFLNSSDKKKREKLMEAYQRLVEIKSNTILLTFRPAENTKKILESLLIKTNLLRRNIINF